MLSYTWKKFLIRCYIDVIFVFLCFKIPQLFQWIKAIENFHTLIVFFRILKLVWRFVVCLWNNDQTLKMINGQSSRKMHFNIFVFKCKNKWSLSVYNLIIFSNFPQIKSALDEQLKCFVLKVSVKDIMFLFYTCTSPTYVYLTQRLKANE